MIRHYLLDNNMTVDEYFKTHGESVAFHSSLEHKEIYKRESSDGSFSFDLVDIEHNTVNGLDVKYDAAIRWIMKWLK